MVTPDQIEQLLTGHVQSLNTNRCSCSWCPDISYPVSGPNNIHRQHRQHLADQLAEFFQNAA